MLGYVVIITSRTPGFSRRITVLNLSHLCHTRSDPSAIAEACRAHDAAVTGFQLFCKYSINCLEAIKLVGWHVSVVCMEVGLVCKRLIAAGLTYQRADVQKPCFCVARCVSCCTRVWTQ